MKIATQPDAEIPRDDITDEEKRQAIEQVLISRYFAHAPKKQRFLRLICQFNLEGKGKKLNEYLIGHEVFDRDSSYNPATDPIVRVGAHAVREKLTLYYQKEGAADEIRIEIPVGSYEAVFIRQTRPEENGQPGLVLAGGKELDQPSKSLPPTLVSDKNRPASSKLIYGFLALLIVMPMASAMVLWFKNQDLNRRIDSHENRFSSLRSSVAPVWQPFLRSNQPTLLVLSNPIVHRAANPADPDALTRKGITLTPEQTEIMTSAAGNRLPLREDKPLQLIPAFNMYTGIGEALGVYRISNLLHSTGKNTIIKQSRSISADDLKSYNVILLGSIYSNQWSKPMSVKENFIYTPRSSIENLNPQPGEEREYRALFNQGTGELINDYALITVTQGVSSDKMVMVLAGIFSEGTEAAAEFVTDPTHLNELNRELTRLGGKKGPPQNYQALLKVYVENSYPTRISLLTFRELHQTNE